MIVIDGDFDGIEWGHVPWFSISRSFLITPRPLRGSHKIRVAPDLWSIMTAFALQLGQHPAGAGMNPLEFSGSQWDFNGISMGFNGVQWIRVYPLVAVVCWKISHWVLWCSLTFPFNRAHEYSGGPSQPCLNTREMSITGATIELRATGESLVKWRQHRQTTSSAFVTPHSLGIGRSLVGPKQWDTLGPKNPASIFYVAQTNTRKDLPKGVPRQFG